MRFSTPISTTALLVASTTLSSPTPTPPKSSIQILQTRAMTPDEMITNINEITTLSQELQPKVSQINPGTLPLNPAVFQPFIDGIQEIINTANDDITAMGTGSAPYTDEDAEQDICDAFNSFVIVHQALLSIVIGKSGLLQGIFFGPVAAILRALEGVVDTLAFGIIDWVPFCAAAATSDKNNLDGILGQAVCAYTPGGSLGLDLFC